MGWPNHPRLRPLRRRSRLADFSLDVLDGFTRHRTGRNASLLAYMGLLTVFPLLLAATTVLGLVLEGDEDLQEQILDSFLSRIPVIGPSLVQNQGELSGSWLALAIGLGGALWGSLRAFVALQTALDDIWEVEEGRRNFFQQRLSSLIFIGAIGVSQIGAVSLAAAVGHAGLPRTSQFLLTFGGLALNVAVIGAVYRFMTSKAMTWSMVWPGTLFTSVVYTALQFAGTNILTRRLDGAEEVYGTFAALIVLAFWISIHGLIALIGAEINAARQRRRHRAGAPPERSAPAIRTRGSDPRPESAATATGDRAGNASADHAGSTALGAPVSHLFVYGTLQPGDVRWPILAPFIAGDGVADAVAGRVYDTGQGYPAATFGGDGTIRGRTYRLRGDRLEEALVVLDAEEASVPGGYRRVEVTTAGGTRAWAYEYGGGLELTPIEHGDWLHR